jgi:tetratricopeptide (TPR) repeat protein
LAARKKGSNLDFKRKDGQSRIKSKGPLMKKSSSFGSFPWGIVLVAALVWGSACAPSGSDRIRTTPSPDDAAIRIVEAQKLIGRGHYTAFKKAASLYRTVYDRPARKKSTAEPYLRSLILLRIRECQIGIILSPTTEIARGVVRDNPALQNMLPFVEMADMLSAYRPSGGIQTDINPVPVKRIDDDVDGLRRNLRPKTGTEDYYAYLYVSFFGTISGYFEQHEDLSRFYGLFPDSPLMAYANAVRYTQEQPEILDRLVRADAEFYEAHYHLGEIALGEKKLVKAETNFLKALPGLGDSPQETIYLASIYTATEEFEKSLEFYDRTLALSPGYRDAILGKAISQSYLGRFVDAIVTLNKMIELGHWLLGECHYWLAWNYHALKNEDEAQAHIEESKGRLPTNSEVFGLAGTIALNRDQLDRAEKEFGEALRYNAANTEALFGLGRISDLRSKWPDAAGYYAQAAGILARNEAAIRERIAEIKTLAMGEERRAQMLAKKESQLGVTRMTWAAACYDAAVAWSVAGLKDRALPWAEKASTHPQFKDKAAALIAKIK